MTVRKIVILSAFMDCAARIQTGFTVFTPVQTAITMGRNTAKVVMMTTVWLPRPNQMTAMGTHARAGMGSSTAMRGTKKDSQKAKRPIITPMTSPRIAPRTKDKGSRQAVWKVCQKRGLWKRWYT